MLSVLCRERTVRENGAGETDRQTETERGQNSELYYTRIKVLGSCLFLQSVPAKLHANRIHIKHVCERERERERERENPTQASHRDMYNYKPPIL